MFVVNLLAHLRTLLHPDQLRLTMSKYLPETIMLIDYVPFVGPLYNASYALNLLFNFWPIERFFLFGFWFKDAAAAANSEAAADDHDNSEDIDAMTEDYEKSHLIREKGIIAIMGALIDLGTLCLMLGVMAYVSTCLSAIETWYLVRYLIFALILSNVFALTLASKIITNQLALYATRQLDDVNQVGASVVKSAAITVTAIEKLVETTNTTGNKVVDRVNYWYDVLHNIAMLPYRCLRATQHFCHRQISAAVARLLLLVRTIQSTAPVRFVFRRKLA